ncbi:hypothetical protein HSBAA_45700 [Vreelandella sulfidaeris]|uniref:Outer-membrane lipoprotein LolB n=1 Tax=Vreelandella sulfidaeris TaxID=115553 RepID=A0A455UK06_9GAMM|nr:hypothetical protein HSBAA_45700 [Halomonas sulfidaeris]
MPTLTSPSPRWPLTQHSSRLWLAGFALLLLAGCASQAPMDESGRQAGQWERQQAEVEAFDTWTLVGKAGLRTPEENVSANLDWNQTPHYFRMLISGPFGGGRNVLEGREGRFSLSIAMDALRQKPQKH